MAIKITPQLLDRLRGLAQNCQPPIWEVNEHSDVVSVAHTVAEVAYDEDAQFIAAADPATVLAIIEEIERLRALQCWIVVELNGELAAGPFFTKCDAENFRMAKLCDDEEYSTYKVQVWNGNKSEAGQ